MYYISAVGGSEDDCLKIQIWNDKTITKLKKEITFFLKERGEKSFQTSQGIFYKTLVAPHLDYCSMKVYLANEENLNKL